MSKIFAYGSLLNKNTWSFEADLELVNLKGWIRQWRQVVQIDKGKICALTIYPNSNATIEGILLKVDEATELLLNGREIGYEKTILTGKNIIEQSTKKQLTKETAITYIGSKTTAVWASKEAPILLSYIDVVAKGYYDLFGWEGVINFFSSTQGWNLPILDDRDKPIYPRAAKHDKHFLKFIDQQLLIHSKKVMI